MTDLQLINGYLEFDDSQVNILGALFACMRNRSHKLLEHTSFIIVEVLKHINTTEQTNLTFFESLTFLWKSLKSPSWSALKQLNKRIIRHIIHERHYFLMVEIDFHWILNSDVHSIDLQVTRYKYILYHRKGYRKVGSYWSLSMSTN